MGSPAPIRLQPARALPLLAALALLAACEDKAQVVVKPDAGVTVVTASSGATVTTAKEGESLAVPEGLPAFAPAYPGATVKTEINGLNGPDGPAKGMLLVLLTADPVAKVAAFYDQRAKAAGVAPGMQVNEADSAVRIFGKGPEAGRSAQGALIAISKSDEGPGTEIVITSGIAREQVETWEKDDFRNVPRPLPRLQ